MYSDLIGLVLGLFGTSMFVSEISTYVQRRHRSEWQRALERQHRKHQ